MGFVYLKLLPCHSYQIKMKNLIILIILISIVSCYASRTTISRDANSPPLPPVDYNTMSIGDSTKCSVSNFDEMEIGLDGRMVIYRNHDELLKVTSGGNGKIFVITCFNRAGDPEFLKIDQLNTTINSKERQAAALEMVSKYKIEIDTLAPQYQCRIIKLFINTDRRRF